MAILLVPARKQNSNKYGFSSSSVSVGTIYRALRLGVKSSIGYRERSQLNSQLLLIMISTKHVTHN